MNDFERGFVEELQKIAEAQPDPRVLTALGVPAALALPPAVGGLAGAGLGAGIGALTTKDEEERKRRALLGAGIGGGVGYAAGMTPLLAAVTKNYLASRGAQ